MTYNCSECGTALNKNFYVCSTCQVDNTSSIISEENLIIRMEEVTKDKINAKEKGFKTLRAYYENEFYKLEGTFKRNIFGKKVIKVKLNPAYHIRIKPGEMFSLNNRIKPAYLIEMYLDDQL